MKYGTGEQCKSVWEGKGVPVRMPSGIPIMHVFIKISLHMCTHTHRYIHIYIYIYIYIYLHINILGICIPHIRITL